MNDPFDYKSIFDFKMPQNLINAIKDLQIAITEHPSSVDLYQDEIRSLAHGDTYDSEQDARAYGGLTEDEAEEVIDYFCRRRWVHFTATEKREECDKQSVSILL